MQRLAEAGHDVVGEASTSVVARAFTRTLGPEAVVLDVELPDRGGLALITEIKGIAPRVVIVVLTNALPYRRHCLQLGADVFLDKSAEFDAVGALLAGAVP